MKEVTLLQVIRMCPGAMRCAVASAFLCLIAVSYGYAQQTETSEEHNSRGGTLSAKGDVNGAIAEYQAALRLNPNSAQALNSLAWLYATAKDATLRDPSKALKYALQAVALDQAKNANYLNTLAKAYDVNGDYVNAVLTEKKALAIPLDDATRKKFETSLEWYEQGTVPADTATFVPYCANNFEICRIYVLNVNSRTIINEMGGAHGCTFPRPREGGRPAFHEASIAATKAILDWLKANGASLAPKPEDAIEQAMAAIWPSECVH
jgi:tetratricopeptide (TPR) repeat protein